MTYMGRIVLQVSFVWSALLFGLLGCAAYTPPQSVSVSFDRRAQTQADEHVRVHVSVLSAEESRAVFGVALYDVGVQPVWIQIENLDRVPYVLFDAHIDTQKFSPMEAAHRSHRLLSPSFNREVDTRFQERQTTRLIPPGSAASGFVYTNLDLGAKEV